MRLQVPGQVVRSDPVPVALLLPGQKEHSPDALPYRTHVRQGGPVRGAQVRAGDLCDLRGQEVVRPVPQGPLLLHADVVCAVPQGVVLPGGIICSPALPGGQDVPAGVVHAALMMPCEARVN